MATVANTAKHRLATPGVNLATLDVRALLLDGSQATDPDRDFVAALTGEVVGTGYTRKALTTPSVVRDDVDDWTYYTADAVQWDAIDVGVVDRMVLFVQGVDDTDSWLLSYHLVRVNGAAPTTNGGTLSVPPSPAGYVRLS